MLVTVTKDGPNVWDGTACIIFSYKVVHPLEEILEGHTDLLRVNLKKTDLSQS